MLKNNILKSKEIILNINKNILNINSCDNFVTLLIVIIREKKRIKHVVRLQTIIIILIHFCLAISIKMRNNKLFVDRNFMFNFTDINRFDKKNGVFSHIVNVNFFVIQIKNVINQSIAIIKNKRLNILIKYEKKSCYFVTLKMRYFVVEF